MVLASVGEVRSNFKEYCNRAYEGETVVITRVKNENVVMIGEEEYNRLKSFMRISSYVAMLGARQNKGEQREDISQKGDLSAEIQMAMELMNRGGGND